MPLFIRQPKGGVPGTHAPEDDSRFLVAPVTGNGRNTVRFRLAPVACWRVDELRFDFDLSFVRPELSLEIEQLWALREEHKNGEYPPLSLFGHADPTGNNDYNKQLSGRRVLAI